MGEKLEVYDLKGKFLGIEDRKEFYKEIKEEFEKNGKITKKVKRSILILMNSRGRMILQRRSHIKKENPGLYDKTLGGHVIEGDTYNMTLIKECAEELGFPVSILTPDEFKKAIKKIDLRVVGLFKKIDFIPDFISTRITKKGDKFMQPYFNTSYIGYYDGAIQFIDGESSGVEVLSLDELNAEIADRPHKFTEDLKFMINKYKKYIKPIH